MKIKTNIEQELECKNWPDVIKNHIRDRIRGAIIKERVGK